MGRERRKREHALPRFPFHCYTNPCKQRSRIIGFRCPLGSKGGKAVGIRQVAPYDSFSILRPTQVPLHDPVLHMSTFRARPPETPSAYQQL
jgi:hypothetical protein